MSIAIIVPVHDRADVIGSAIASILRQRDAGALDVIVVDDGSADGTADVLADIARRESRVRVFRQDNAGVSAARNAGLRRVRAGTRFVTFLDSDDLMAEGRLSRDVALLERHPKAALSYGDMVITDAFDRDAMAPAPDAGQARLKSLHMACTLYRRAAIDAVGPFDETLRMAEDTDFIFRTFERGVAFVETSTVCHYYLRHPGNLTRSFADQQRWFSRAVLKRLARRRDDPTLSQRLPAFSIDPRDRALFA